MIATSPMQNCQISSWQQFGRNIRKKNYKLLGCLSSFPNSVLITGCQRSGTTMLTRIINMSDEMVNFQFGKDDELDAALILCGVVASHDKGRYCFQTTYLNERYVEYIEHREEGHKIIWVLRNPQSVVYSMLHNWGRFALNELFDGCGAQLLTGKDKARYERFGRLGVSRIKRACFAYAGKTCQVFEMLHQLGSDKVKVVLYDDLVKAPDIFLKDVFAFINVKYIPILATRIHSRSLAKHNRLSTREHRMVRDICEPIFLKTLKLIKK